MKFRFVFVALVAAGLILQAGCIVGYGGKKTKSKPPVSRSSARGDTQALAPAECLATARGFVAYFLDARTNIANDAVAQERWLSRALRAELEKKVQACEEEAKRRPDDKIEGPSNGTFLLTWDPPTTANIIGSRRYEDVSFVVVELKWGPGTNYEGSRRIESLIFVLEDGAWKLDDVYSLREKFAEAGTLGAELRGEP